VVTSGIYSAYHIVAIFLDRELADHCVAQTNEKDEYERCKVEVWPVQATPIVWREDLVKLMSWPNMGWREDHVGTTAAWWTGRPVVAVTQAWIEVIAGDMAEAQHLFGEAKSHWQRTDWSQEQ
jgi:hypothetical protein